MAAWLVNNRGRMRSLCIPGTHQRLISGWAQDVTSIRDALMGPQQGLVGGTALPHLVQLELPVLGLAGSSAFLQALAACTGLQQLTLQITQSMYDRSAEPIDLVLLASTLASLKQLRVLHLELPGRPTASDSDREELLRQLPPSLEELKVEGYLTGVVVTVPQEGCHATCISHLVNLRSLDGLTGMVDGDISSSSGSSGDDDSSSSGGSSSSSSSSSSRGLQVLTALTRLRIRARLSGDDPLLQLPNLREVDTDPYMGPIADPEAWKQLQGMQHLQHLTVSCAGEEDVCTAGMRGMTQLVGLHCHGISQIMHQAVAATWAEVIGAMTRLTTLRLPPAEVVLVGPMLLPRLTQLKVLTVEFLHWQQGVWRPAEVVQVVAEAVADGWGPLQRLVLERPQSRGDWEEGAQQVAAAAQAALPGVTVVVQQP
jgi:hypothetical protein